MTEVTSRVGAVVLVLLGLVGAVAPSPRPAGQGSAWPAWTHPLGLDASGRDFLAVLASGAADFVVPGLWAVGLLLLVVVGRCLLIAIVPPVGEVSSSPAATHRLILAAPPRLLLVLVVMMLLPEPSPLVAAGVVLALHLPLTFVDLDVAARQLAREEILAGAVAHGLSPLRIAWRHLLFGWLRPLVTRHAAALFSQVAATQIAISYLLGASAVTPGLGVSWGMELRRQAALLPTAGMPWCRAGGSCPAASAGVQVVALVGTALFLLGAVARLGETRVSGAEA